MPSTKGSVYGVDEVVKNLEKTLVQVKDAAGTAVQITAAQAVVYAKQNAPWTDRSGDARRSIHMESSDNGMGAYVGIGMFYGKYLETNYGGRYRIVDPAVFSYGKNMFIRNLKGIL